MKDKRIIFLIRIYMVLLLISLAFNIQLFPIPALSVDSVPLPFFVFLAGMIFCGIFYRDLLLFLRERKIILLMAGLFLLSGILSALLSPFPAILGLKSLFHYGLFFGISFLFLFLFQMAGKNIGFFFLKILVVLTVLLAFVSFLEITSESVYRFLTDTFRNGVDYDMRGLFKAGALQPNPNVFGCLMSLGLLSAFYLKEETELQAMVFYGVAVILALAMALSCSGSAALILLIPLFLLLWNRKTFKTAAAVIGISVVALTAVIVFGAAPSGTAKLFPVLQQKNLAVDGKGGRRPDTISTRISLWQSAWAMFRDYPLTGIGPGGSNRAMKDYASENLRVAAKRNLQREYLNAHNGILNILSEFGLSGAAAALALIAYLLVCFIRRYGAFPFLPAHALLAAIILSFLPDAFFYSLFYMSAVFTIFLLFAFPGHAFGSENAPVQSISGEKATGKWTSTFKERL